MNVKNQDASIYQYLNEIDSGPLLTRAEEENLIKNIEVYQLQIIEGALISHFSRSEMLSYLKSLQSSGEDIVDISKKLDGESPTEMKSQILEHFTKLIVALERHQNGHQDIDASLQNIKYHLDQVGISGTIVHGIVTEIKKKHTRVYEADSTIKQVKKWFEGYTLEAIIELVSKIRSNEEIRLKLRKELGLTNLQMLNKCGEWENIINHYNETLKFLPEGVTFQVVKDAYSKISDSEFKMKKFKDQLIERNLRLVVSRAKKFLNRGLELEDLIQEGNIGLMKAIDKFDSSKKTKISTYATLWIDQCIRRAISNKGKTVRIPTHIEFQQTKLNETIHKLQGKLKRPPTLKEISVETGIELKTLEDLQLRAKHEVGIDEELPSGVSLMELLPSDTTYTPETVTENKILQEKIREILSTLPPRTEKIIRLRFGIGEVPKELEQFDNDEKEEGLTLQVIGDHIGITKQGVRVVETSALKKVKKKLSKFVEET